MRVLCQFAMQQKTPGIKYRFHRKALCRNTLRRFSVLALNTETDVFMSYAGDQNTVHYVSVNVIPAQAGMTKIVAI